MLRHLWKRMWKMFYVPLSKHQYRGLLHLESCPASWSSQEPVQSLNLLPGFCMVDCFSSVSSIFRCLNERIWVSKKFADTIWRLHCYSMTARLNLESRHFGFILAAWNKLLTERIGYFLMKSFRQATKNIMHQHWFTFLMRINIGACSINCCFIEFLSAV